jgi:ketosteroid isomerase-like protein
LAHDVEPVVALYADDCLHRSTPFRPPHHGRQAVREYVSQAFADEQRIDDVRFGTPVVQGDRACVEYWAWFRDQNGTAMTLAGCAMARFDASGRISEARDYWHLAEGHRTPPQE